MASSGEEVQVGDIVVVDLTDPVILNILQNKKTDWAGGKYTRLQELKEVLGLQNNKRFGVILEYLPGSNGAPNYKILWQGDVPEIPFREYVLSRDEFKPNGKFIQEDYLKWIIENKIIPIQLDPDISHDDLPKSSKMTPFSELLKKMHEENVSKSLSSKPMYISRNPINYSSDRDDGEETPISVILPDFDNTPAPLHGTGGGKKTRKSRKSRKSRKVRKSYKKYRKSRKARKSRRRARR